MSVEDGAESHARRVAAAAQREITTFQLPSWLGTIGVGSWLTVGILALAAVVLIVLALVTEVSIPLAIAAVLAPILVPLPDRLESRHVPPLVGRDPGARPRSGRRGRHDRPRHQRDRVAER